jgi:hypothetical protein
MRRTNSQICHAASQLVSVGVTFILLHRLLSAHTAYWEIY